MKTLTVPDETPVFPLRWVVATNDEAAPLVIRLMLALVLFPHGAQKLLGWFGGYGFDGTMQYFTETVNLPYLLSISIILIEFVTPFLLIAGLFTRVVGVLVSLLFTGIILTAHVKIGFFMNWDGNQPGEGFEYHLLIVAMAVSLLLSGGGKLSLDNRLAK